MIFCKQLQNITFTIEDQEIIGLIERNGKGESTLLKILAAAANTIFKV